MPLDLPSAFVSDVDVPLGAADLNGLRDACMLLDGLAAGRILNVCCSSGSQRTGAAADWHPRGDYRQSWWGLRYRTGMEDLTIEGECDYSLDIYINGVLNTNQAASAGFTKVIDISTGYADGDIILIEIRTNGNPAGAPAGYSPLYRIEDVYAGPIVVDSAWSGLPTFAGTYSGALLNQLMDAAQYIWERITAIPILPWVAGIMIPATHKQETIRMFDGSVGRYASNEVLRVTGTIICRTNAEHYEIDYDGVTEVTSATYTAGQTFTFSHPIPLTHTIGTTAPVAIRAVCEDDVYDDQPGVYSSYNWIVVRSEADSSGYATHAPPTEWSAGESISAATLNTRLNTLGALLFYAVTAINARPELWDRARAYRRVYASDDTQVARNFRRHCAQFQRGLADTLIVRGKGVKIGWGAITFKPPEEENEPVNYSDFTWASEVSVGEGDQIMTSTVVLDGLEGLERGMLYYVFGTVVEYAGEQI